MRSIKFRGKAVMSIEELDEMEFEHERGWVFGNLIQNGDNPWIVGDFIEINSDYVAHEFWVKVEPETVGQYTGLNDEKGRKKYEGDIVRQTNEKIITKEKNK